MGDSFYPSVCTDFLISNIVASGLVILESQKRIGSTITFVMKGNQPLHKRLLLFREFTGEVNYEQATALAIRLRFMGSLLKWLEVQKNWKEGAYVEVDKESEN